MEVNIHLTFKGQCEEAFNFYQDVLGGKITLMLSYGNSPEAAQTPSEWKEKIVHANLEIGNTVISGVDVIPGDYEPPQGFFALLEIDEASQAKRVFEVLSIDGKVKMPIQKTFWSAYFGVVVDRFGIPWEITCTQPANERG
jgi:PhnB protein